MSEKMMSFEEWWQTKPMYKDLKEAFEATFNAARLGTIPAENAIVVPDVSKWDDDTTELTIYAYDQRGCQQFHLGIIPRPVPAWAPNVGDAVFVKVCEDVLVGVVKRERENGAWFDIMGPKGLIMAMAPKPFSPSKIGLPWEKI